MSGGFVIELERVWGGDVWMGWDGIGLAWWCMEIRGNLL